MQKDNSSILLLKEIKKLTSKVVLLEKKNQEFLEIIKDLNQELKRDKIGLYEK